MALHIPRAPGFAQMIKEGAKHISGLDESVLRNIDACKELAETTRSAYGPYGQNKMIINHLEKLFVTNDAATIIKELEVQHPAAKMMVMGAHQQEAECGDGTNFVLIFSGALLENAETLLRMGLSICEIIAGYELACKKAVEIIPTLTINKLKNIRDMDEVIRVICSPIMSKQYGLEDFLAKLIAEACISVLTDNDQFNVDNIRICKIAGQGVVNSTWVKGLVFKRHVEGAVKKAMNCKIAVYTCPLDTMQTETKGTVLLKTAVDLMDYSKGEETQIDEQIKSIADTGVKVIVTGGKVGELYQHFCNKYNLMIVRVPSKFDIRRLCKSIRATALPRITPPTAEEAGSCDLVTTDEIGDTSVIIFRQGSDASPVSTLVLRGATDNIMDDIERCVDDAVNTYKCLTKETSLLAGAGAWEIELAKQISTYGEKISGMAQYSIKKFAESLEALPRAIATNAGVKSSEVISKLHAAHQQGKKTEGVDIDMDVAATKDAAAASIFDVMQTRVWAVRFAVAAACTILSVDQIIMAKQSGGPKPKEAKNNEDED